MTSHRSAPGGSGAGGSVVIITKTLQGNLQGKIFVQGGVPVKCAFGAGGGKLISVTQIFSVNDDNKDADDNGDGNDDGHDDNDHGDTVTKMTTRKTKTTVMAATIP